MPDRRPKASSKDESTWIVGGRRSTNPPPGNDMVWAPGKLLLGEYDVVRELGTGGAGTVYLVRSQITDQQFAVKTVLPSAINDADSKRQLIEELQTWIDLPRYPHLTTCWFFRTIGERLAIFAEYVGGGTLKEWIQAKRLESPSQMIDVAMQIAWGLAAAHDSGVVHQDIKPTNVLLTAEGIAKLTDFGMARSKPMPASAANPLDTAAPLVTTRGLTLAYCSPEQAMGRRLDIRSDIWSWGITLYEMLTGEMTWQFGLQIRDAFTSSVRAGFLDHWGPAGTILMTVLDRCFRLDPPQRWQTMNDVVEQLEQAYRKATGHQYPRQRPEPVPVTGISGGALNRRESGGVSWRDPRWWLIRAFALAGRDRREYKAMLPSEHGSRRARLLGELQVFEEAIRIYRDLISSGRKDLELEMARLSGNKASLHEVINDLPGALAAHQIALDIFSHHIFDLGQQELADELASACVNKANIHKAQGDSSAALALYDQAIRLREQAYQLRPRDDLLNMIASVHVNRAIVLIARRETEAALAACDQAIACREELFAQTRRETLERDLATAYLVKATTLNAGGDSASAVTLYKQAIAILDRYREKSSDLTIVHQLGNACQNMAIAQRDCGDIEAALASHDRAIAIWKMLSEAEPMGEAAFTRSVAYVNKANALRSAGRIGEALTHYDEGISSLRDLIDRKGRSELNRYLARALSNKGRAVALDSDPAAAIPIFDEAIRLLERLQGRQEPHLLWSEAGWTWRRKAETLEQIGAWEDALTAWDHVIHLWTRLAQETTSSRDYPIEEAQEHRDAAAKRLMT